MIVLRWPKEQRDLFDKSPYQYHAVLTSFDDWTAGLVLQFHRNRQDGSENVNKDPKKYPFREVFEAARWRLFGLSVELAPM